MACRIQLEQQLHNAVLKPVFRWYKSTVDNNDSVSRLAQHILHNFAGTSRANKKSASEAVLSEELIGAASAVVEQLLLYATEGQHVAADAMHQQQELHEAQQKQLKNAIRQMEADVQVQKSLLVSG